MSVPYATVRLVASGTIAGTQTWSIGIRVAPTAGGPFPNPINQATLDTWVTNRVINFRDWWSTVQGSGGAAIATLNTADTLLTALKGYYYPANSDAASVMSTPTFGTALAGTSSTNAPAQTALVASLLSTTPGRTGRGRLYLPGTGLPIAGDHRSGAGTAGGSARNTASLLTAINGSSLAGSSVVCIVASTAGPRPITSVRVDNRPDVQRRRADKLLATGQVTIAV